MTSGEWYFCLKHQAVEPKAGCRAGDRLGPYPDRESAAQAPEIAQERTAAADEADRRWEEGD